MVPSGAAHGSRSDTVSFIKSAIVSLDSMFKPGVPCGKAGVMLFDLRERGHVQGNVLLMAQEADDARRNALMESLDAASHRYGRGPVKFGVEGPGRGV